MSMNKKGKTIKTTKTITMARKTAKRVSTRKKTVDTNAGFTSECYKSIQVGRSFALMTTNGDVVTKVTGVTKAKMK